MTTKSITSKSGKTITVEMVRKVQDKVNYADGYNIVTGREIVEYTTITLRDQSGKTLMTGSHMDTVTPQGYRNHRELIAQGAVARIGDVYITQEIVDLVTATLAVVEAETPKSDEQIAIETAQAQAIKAHDDWYCSQDQISARKLEREMDNPNSDL